MVSPDSRSCRPVRSRGCLVLAPSTASHIHVLERGRLSGSAFPCASRRPEGLRFRLMASSWPAALSHEELVSFGSGHASIETSCWQTGTALVGRSAFSRSRRFPKIFTCPTFQQLWAWLSSGSTDCASYSMMARLGTLTSLLSTGLVSSNRYGTLVTLRKCASIQKPPRLHGQTALILHLNLSMRRPGDIHSGRPEQGPPDA